MLFRSLLFAVGFVGRQFGSPFCGAIPSAATRSSSPRCPDDRTGLRIPPLARALLPLARALAARGLGEAAGHLVAVERRRSGRGGRAAPSRSAHLGRCPPHRRSTYRKSTRLNSNHVAISCSVFCLEKRRAL